MKRYFNTRPEQDAAIKKLLVSMGTSTSIFPLSFIEAIDPSDHQFIAAMILRLIDIRIDDRGFVRARVSDDGNEWLLTH